MRGRVLGRAETARGIYGTILAMAVMVGVSKEPGIGAGAAFVTLSVTIVGFWLAHVYSRAISLHAESADRRWLVLARGAAAHELPMLRAALPAAGTVILWWVGVIGRNTAVTLTLGIGLVELAVLGWILARRSGESTLVCVVTAGANVALGATLVALKVLVH
jgi:hypothetical protein